MAVSLRPAAYIKITIVNKSEVRRKMRVIHSIGGEKCQLQKNLKLNR